MKRLIIFVVPAVILIAAIATGLHKTPVSNSVVSTDNLPTVGSAAKLKELLAGAQNRMYPLTAGGAAAETFKSSADQAVSSPAQNQGRQSESTAFADFSGTNIQVDGVDEADVVKTDGKYIYYVNKNTVGIFLAHPAESMKKLSSLEFSSQKFIPQELYVDAKNLVVIGTGYRQESGPTPDKSKMRPGAELQIYPLPGQNTTRAIVYDISDRANPKHVREAELDGGYISSRKIGANLYLVARKYMDYYRIMNRDPEVPAYRDTLGTGEYVSIPYPDIHYFPGFSEPGYLMVGALNLERKEPMHVASYLGAGQYIYASATNLYVAVAQYEMPGKKPDAKGNVSSTKPAIDIAPVNADTTLYKFALDTAKTTYKAQGSVPGTILNQFSMDEYKGFFRIATTKGQTWRNDENTSKNNLYILDESLKVTGKLEDIAPGEKIYSTRFLGDRAYMVTFKTVDPLFVLDLKEPAAPKIAGALKIPGYSDYIQPYDENHIIGFGKDTVEGSYPGRNIAYYLGMKIALFDVSDLQHPVEKFREIIGDRGTDSELLHNHKALLFDKSKNLLAFPVTLMEVKKQQANTAGMPQYGEFVFQGALIYRVDPQQGFKLRGKITHLSQDDYLQSGRGWHNGDTYVERILYIKDTLYTLSKTTIKANELEGLREINSLSISP